MEQSKYIMPTLDKNLIKKIIFSMENQNSLGFLDLYSSEIIEVNSINDSIELPSIEDEGIFEKVCIKDNESRFLAIPVWGPLEGFKMRESFIENLKNPLYKDKLDKVLHTGRGVFRKFKEVLHTSPLIERQWYEYKKDYMQLVVKRWFSYNDGIVKLEDLPLDIEELPDDLLIEDFTFEFLKESDRNEEIDVLTNIFFKELSPCESLIIKKNISNAKNTLHLIVLTPDEKIVGFIKYNKNKSGICEILAYGISYEYRGIGLFGILLDKLIRQLSREGFSSIIIFYTSNSLKVSKKIKNIELFCNLSYFQIDFNVWIRDNPSSETIEV